MPKKTRSTEKSGATKKTRMNPQQRAQRMQQVLFLGLALIVVISMILALVVR
jgi:hypothetical protein